MLLRHTGTQADPDLLFCPRFPFPLVAVPQANSNRAGRKKEGVRYPRSIMHPQFKNLTHLEAEEFLKEVYMHMYIPSVGNTYVCVCFFCVFLDCRVVSEEL